MELLSFCPWTQPSTTPSPSLAEGVFTVTHPFHPLYGKQFEILNYRHNWGEYRVTFYETPEHIRALPAAWTSIALPDPSVMLAAGRAALRVADCDFIHIMAIGVNHIVAVHLVQKPV